MPMSSRSTPSPMVTVRVCVSWCRMVGVSVFCEPREPPLRVPSMPAKRLVTFHWTGAGVPTFASGTVWTAGSKSTPSAETPRVYGLSRSGDVRRASTSTSQTPGVGFG